MTADSRTTNPVVLLHSDRPEMARQIVAQRHPDLTLHTHNSYSGMGEALVASEPDVVYSIRFAGTPGFPRDALLGAPSVKWVSVGGSGIDHLRPWDTDHLTVTNAAGVAADMMAQYALGMILSFSLNLPEFRADQQNRVWRPDGKMEPVTGKTVLIIGLGQSGRSVARHVSALGMKTIGVRANPQPTEHVDEVHGMDALPSLWARADYVVVCVPLLDTTQGLVNDTAFAAMKPGAVLIDMSRGTVTDETALLRALDSGRLRGAAMDVFETEPLPPEHPLWAYDNVIITPHCSSVYDGWEEKSVEMFCENLTRYREGRPLTNVVDPARGY